MENYSVYIHINKLNNKKYVGITSMNPAIRWKNGNGYKKQKRFYSAIKSYGWNGFEHIVLERGLSKDEAEQREEQLIEYFHSNNLAYGYNIENGGATNKLSEEQKKHLATLNTGKRHSEETKEKIREAHLKIGAPWLNGRKAADTTKAKMSESRKGTRNGRARAVYQYSLDGKFLYKYEYMDLIKDAIGIKNTAHIIQCCNNKRSMAHGFMWSYSLENKQPYKRIGKAG